MVRWSNNEHLECLKWLVGEPESEEGSPLFDSLCHLFGGMAMLETSLNSLSSITKERFKDLFDDLKQIVVKVHSRQENMENEIIILEKVIAALSSSGERYSKSRVSEPQLFHGSRDAK